MHVVRSFQLPRHGQSYLIAGIFLRSLTPCSKINRMVQGHQTSGEVFLLSDTSKSSSGFKKINKTSIELPSSIPVKTTAPNSPVGLVCPDSSRSTVIFSCSAIKSPSVGNPLKRKDIFLDNSRMISDFVTLTIQNKNSSVVYCRRAVG